MVGLLRLGTAGAMAFAVAVSAGCTTAAESGSDGQSGTLVVWDYYGSATPVKPALAEFERQHPNIKIKYETLDWNSMLDKFAVAVSSGSAPDLATVDMTTISTYAANGVLTDLSKLSGGTLNGKPFADQYNKGALEAMSYKGRYIAALYDLGAAPLKV
jgi:multiple sugar transport system substrate-binding protein